MLYVPHVFMIHVFDKDKSQFIVFIPYFNFTEIML